MAADLSTQLIEARKRLEDREHARFRRVETEDELKQREYHLTRLQHDLDLIAAEIQRLENPGLLGVLGSLLGGSVEKREQLISARYEAQQEFEEVEAQVASLRDQINAITTQLAEGENLEEAIAGLTRQKEEMIRQQGGEAAREYTELAEHAQWADDELRRTERALEAGETALKRIDDLTGALNRVRKSQLHGSATGAIINAGWNTIKAHGTRPFVDRLRQGLEKLGAAIDELDASEGTHEDVEIARIRAMIDHAAAEFSSGWEQQAIYDTGVMNPIESDVSELVGYLKDKLKDRKTLANDLERQKQLFIENA